MYDFDFDRHQIGVPDTFVKILDEASANHNWDLAGHRFGQLTYDLLPEGVIMESWLEPWDCLMVQFPVDSPTLWRAAFHVWLMLVYPDMMTMIPEANLAEFCSGAYDQVMTYDREIDFRKGMFDLGPHQFFPFTGKSE